MTKSGFITSTGIDLDDIFQTIDVSGVLSTGYSVIVSGIENDLVQRYKLYSSNMYPLPTNFFNSLGKDLSTVFEYAAYTPTTPVISIGYVTTDTLDSSKFQITFNCTSGNYSYFSIDLYEKDNGFDIFFDQNILSSSHSHNTTVTSPFFNVPGLKYRLVTVTAYNGNGASVTDSKFRFYIDTNSQSTGVTTYFNFTSGFIFSIYLEIVGGGASGGTGAANGISQNVLGGGGGGGSGGEGYSGLIPIANSNIFTLSDTSYSGYMIVGDGGLGVKGVSFAKDNNDSAPHPDRADGIDGNFGTQSIFRYYTRNFGIVTNVDFNVSGGGYGDGGSKNGTGGGGGTIIIPKGYTYGSGAAGSSTSGNYAGGSGGGGLAIGSSSFGAGSDGTTGVGASTSTDSTAGNKGAMKITYKSLKYEATSYL